MSSQSSQDDRLERLQEDLRECFDNDPHGRYVWEGFIDQGGNGAVYKFRQDQRRIAVKIVPDAFFDGGGGGNGGSGGSGDDNSDEDDGSSSEDPDWLDQLEALDREAGVLQVRDCVAQHQSRGTFRHMTRWIYMEYAENGMLQDFIDRHLALHQRPFPNRLMWRFFMCLVRSSLEMAYYDRGVDLSATALGPLPSMAPGPLAHLDMKGENIVIGDLLPELQNPEHVMSPILKLIDFGSAEDVVDPEARREHIGGPFAPTGSELNIFDIGTVMLYILLHEAEGDYRVPPATEITVGPATFLSFGTVLSGRRQELVSDGVDESLINLICRCLAQDPGNRPGLIELAALVHERVVNRGPGDAPGESDDAIRQMVHDLLLNANTGQAPVPQAVDPPGDGGGAAGEKRQRSESDDDEMGDDGPGAKRVPPYLFNNSTPPTANAHNYPGICHRRVTIASGDMTQTDLFPGQSGLPVDNPTESYWLKEPSEKLLGHRTTERLPRTADVVIVGSGITGAFAAHFLKERHPNLDVVMLEAREACWGATGRNGGHCQPAVYASAAAPHIAAFELRTYAYLKALVEEHSIPCDWRTTSGVHAFYSAELFGVVRGAVARLADGYPDLAANVAVVERGGAVPWLLEGERREMTLEGLRVGGAAGAVVQWNAASLWPYKLVAFVLERLLAAGRFNLQTSTPATGLSSSSAAGTATATTTGAGARDGGGGGTTTLWTVHTPRGTVTAPRVLLATNAYTSHLLPQFADLIVPVRGQVSALKPPPPPPAQSSPPPPPPPPPPQPPLDIGHTFAFAGEPDDPYSRDDYLIQRPPPAAELVFGGGRKHAAGRGVGVWDDASTDEPVAWYLRGELGGLMDLSHRPSLLTTSTTTATSAYPPTTEKTAAAGESRKKQDLEPTHEWTGIMGFSRDGHPWVGVVPPSLGGGGLDGRGLAVCAGFTGHGMPNAALCAKAVVSLMMAASDEKEEDAEEDDEEEIDLPPEYLLTEARVGAARLLDEVDVVDAKGSLFMDFANLGGTLM
ncbi:hypothetical protein DL766_000065 [Monosporascus sp. MC13-8B]|nr:hypothetical protein DL763_007923 [Monosporascus cannonballus]RYP40041.1 hypothetical protein DL766_000065 [Monosporascus sp. MC13-8B]